MILVVQPHPPFIRTSILFCCPKYVISSTMVNLQVLDMNGRHDEFQLVGWPNEYNHHVSWLNPLNHSHPIHIPISIAIPFVFIKTLSSNSYPVYNSFSFISYPMKSQFSWLRTQDPFVPRCLCCGISACDQEVEDKIPGRFAITRLTLPLVPSGVIKRGWLEIH